MRRSGICLLMLLSTAVSADNLVVQRQPTVVYEGSSTVQAWPYYRRLQKQPTKNPPVEPRREIGFTALEDRLPISPTRLRVDQPSMHIQPGQVTPLFVMGMDARSLDWFHRAAPGLAKIGARGVVVEASQRHDWHNLRAQAAENGIHLMLLPGDSLAEGYGITTYPVVIVSPQLAQEGDYE